MRNFLAVIILLALGTGGHTQDYASNIGEGILFNLSLAAQFPGADLASRFGNNMGIGGGLEYISSEKNWIIGFQSNFMFGNQVKIDVLESLRTEQGYIIGNDRSPADIQLRERGFFVGGLIGKLISLSEVNPRSGLRITVGVGLLQHEIRVQDDPVRYVPQLSGDYKKGYDRLTNGLAFNQFIGYQLLSANRRINFFIGVECTQGFTQSRRDFDFDTMAADTEKRLDLLYGIRAGWVLPFYFGKGSDKIYY